MIYCLEILNFKYIKFGFTSKNDLTQRISSLQTGCPFEIKPVFFIEGTIKQEKELHKTLSIAFGRMNIPIPPNEWYPGRNTASKHALEMITQKRGGINHAISCLDKWNPSLNQLTGSSSKRSDKVKLQWPAMSETAWSKVFGNTNNSKPPKIRKKTLNIADHASQRHSDHRIKPSK